MNATQVFTKLLYSILKCLAAVGITSSALADVNLQQASYYKTWTDFTVESKKLKFSFQRTYRSRSIHQGILGFGWCTDFEKSLEFHPSQDITLKDCHEDHPLLYKKVRKEYVSVLDPKDKITMTGGHFQRQKGLIKQIFDIEGRLIELKYFKWPVEIFYGPDQRIHQIKINHDQVITLKFTPKDGDSLTVTAPGKAAFVYQLTNKNLDSVTATSGFRTQYHYNFAHNLIRIEQRGKTIETMIYDNNKDWLTEMSNQSRCKEIFKYQPDKKKPLVFKTIVQKFCDGQLMAESEFIYELREGFGGKYRIEIHPRVASKNGITND